MKKITITLVCSILLFTLMSAIVPVLNAQEQEEIEVACGDIIEGEFTKNVEEHLYSLPMAPRESFTVELTPIGDYLQTAIALYGPTGVRLGDEQPVYVSASPNVESGTLSARGKYKIQVVNAYIEWNGDVNIDSSTGGIGVYTLSIGCIRSDGTVVEPGDNPQPTAIPAPLPTPTVRAALPEAQSTFSGVGFPGLAPVDFSEIALVPLLLDTPMAGVIPTGNEILGFTLEAKAGDVVDLNYTRVSGNYNLGLVVLSAEHQVFFQASLVTSETLTTHLMLPKAGQYTIGVFRISLVDPDEPKPTAFQLEASLSSTE